VASAAVNLQTSNTKHSAKMKPKTAICIVAGTRQVPLIEKLDHGHKKRCHQEQECSDLEKTFHLISISPTLSTAKSAGSCVIFRRKNAIR
jgi:hypothetical protein